MRFGKLAKKACQEVRDFFVKPIRVFCFHQVSDAYNPVTTWKCDWTQTDVFKQSIKQLLNDGYSFISLTEAYEHITKDVFRRKKYAVLTFDDGDSSLKDLLPWIDEMNIPVTLFVNPASLLGESQREKPMDLLTAQALQVLEQKYNRLITIGNHGYFHRKCADLSIEEFQDDVQKSESFLTQYARKIPFYAYPYGSHSSSTNKYLLSINLCPVLCDGQKNYSDTRVIHREVVI